MRGLRRSTGSGSVLVEALQACPEFDAIDAGFVPENFLEVIAGKKPDRILFIDATDFGGVPGQVRLLFPDEVAPSGLSTHAGSLKMLAEYLQARTQAQVALLAIQPADTTAGEELSPEISHTVKVLLEKLPEFCRRSRL
ncbi:MAG: hydrogenase maturation protease [Xanthomonadales bacterium]